MAAYSPNKSVWYNPNIQYLFNTFIGEYDMRDAGYSLIKEFGLLPQSTIDELSKITGRDRHIKIGIIQRDDKEFSRKFQQAFTEARQWFISSNHLTDSQIITVKRDAFFVTQKCINLRRGDIKFRLKNEYTSYIRFPNNHNLELFFNDSGIDIKGMNDSSIDAHRLYMYAFIRSIVSMIERKSKGVKTKMMRFIDEYKSGKLETPYYLEFNNMAREVNPVFNYMNVLVPLVNIIQAEV